MSNTAELIALLSTVIAIFSAAISLITLWITLLQKGKLRMTRPTFIAFAYEPNNMGKVSPKIFLRCLLYSTSRKPQIVEDLFIKLYRGDSVQLFTFWGYGDEYLRRGSGICVPFEGFEYYHHFLISEEDTDYQFIPGDYKLELYAHVIDNMKHQLLYSLNLHLAEENTLSLRDTKYAVGFDWEPNINGYRSYLHYIKK